VAAGATIAGVSGHPVKKTKAERVKALPWAVLLQATFVVGRRWRTLSQKERTRLTALVRESRGRTSNLTEKQRKELRRLVDKLDLKRTGRELLIVAGRGRRKRRRRRHSPR
jgi:hypothetical protein